MQGLPPGLKTIFDVGFIMMVRGCYLMGLLSIINFLSGCGGATMNKEVTNFKWYAVATAPKDYPMKVIQGTFFYKGQNKQDTHSKITTSIYSTKKNRLNGRGF